MSPSVYEAASIDEAVELAENFKAQGVYDWFRGQNEPWSLHSSLFRILRQGDPKRIDRATFEITEFRRWLQETRGLEAIAADPNAVFCIAQHYGIPTFYIDFTTEPGIAAFFACDSERPASTGAQRCIYCLNTQDLSARWRMLGGPELPSPVEMITPAIPNLWRLEAQKGTFMRCETDWEVLYPLDRILFPGSRLPSYPARDDVYPDQKSQLEILLDQFFKMKLGERGVRLEPEETTAGASPGHIVFGRPKGGLLRECLAKETIDPLASWDSHAIAQWLVVPGESFGETTGTQIRINATTAATPADWRDAIRYAMRRALQNPALRTKAVEFRLSGAHQLDRELHAGLRWLWNGLRRLPYSDKDISEGLGNAAFLYRSEYHRTIDGHQAEDIARQCFGDALEVEFTGVHQGVYSRGLVSESKLRAALRPDLEEWLAPQYRHAAANLRHALQIVTDPRRLFEFEPFAGLFAAEIAPCQLIGRPFGAALFSPARLRFFGLP